MDEHGWIRVSERLPGPADSDVQQCVIVWHRLQGVMYTGWHQVENNRFITHWMPVPPPPADYDARYRALQGRTHGG